MQLQYFVTPADGVGGLRIPICRAMWHMSTVHPGPHDSLDVSVF